MKLLSPEEIECLYTRTCPICSNGLDYNELTNSLDCNPCDRHWNFGYYKYCRNYYFCDPKGYILDQSGCSDDQS